MARLTGLLVGDDATFKSELARLLRAASTPTALMDDATPRTGVTPDLVVVDGRFDGSAALAAVERHRASGPAASIFFVAIEARPELIIQSMRAGANEFLTWPPSEAALDEAIQRASARQAASGGRAAAKTLTFFGAKGGSGTTTVAVNCGIELARLSKRPTVIVDLKPGLGEVALFLGMRSRYTLLDAIDNLHRLDAQFMRELVVKHKSGLDILAGGEHFERPAAGDGAAVEEVLRLLGEHYDYVLVDAGSQVNPSSHAAMYAADTTYLVANPDVPSIRNLQRLLERLAQLGANGDRVRILLNRAGEPCPIPPVQIETALGRAIDHMFPSDYRTVSTALNSGVPLALSGDTEIATQFGRFTRGILQTPDGAAESAAKPGMLGFQRLASMW